MLVGERDQIADLSKVFGNKTDKPADKRKLSRSSCVLIPIAAQYLSEFLQGESASYYRRKGLRCP
jgi:hypothetical protein